MTAVAPPKASPAMMRTKLRLNTVTPHYLPISLKLGLAFCNHNAAVAQEIICGLRPSGFAALGAVEEHPGGEIVGEVHEPVLFASRNEEDISGAKRDFPSLALKAPRSGRDNVDLIAAVRMLPVAATRGIQLNRERAMAEEFDRALSIGTG